MSVPVCDNSEMARLDRIAQELPGTPELTALTEFVAASERGITR